MQTCAASAVHRSDARRRRSSTGRTPESAFVVLIYLTLAMPSTDGLRCWTCENDSKQPYAYGNEPLCIPDQQKMPELPDWAYQGQCISAENYACVSIYRNKEDDTPIRRLCTKTRIGNGCHKNAELNGIATSGFACFCRADLCNFRKNITNRIIHFPSDKGPIGTLGADFVADTAKNANAHQPITSSPPSPDRDPRNFAGSDRNEEEQHQDVTTTARTEPEAGDRPQADSANGRRNITKFFDFSPALPQPARSSSGGSGNPKFTQNSVSSFISVFSVACAPVFRKF